MPVRAMAITQTNLTDPAAEAAKQAGAAASRGTRVWRDKHYKWVPNGTGGWKVKSYIVRHRRRPRRGHPRGPGPKPPRRSAVTPPVTPPTPPPPTNPPVIAPPPGAFQGTFGVAQAKRLLDRAAFGPAPGQAAELAELGLTTAVQSLTRPSGTATLQGPAPVDENNLPIAPTHAWGHDHVWWLDRMRRSDQPLVERMTLVFHDWFATSADDVSRAQQMIDQNNLFRSRWAGSFLELARAVTIDPAMLQFLSGSSNSKWSPNENYARELMELFTLGADRGAYTERDIREAARALTGWRNDWSDGLGAHNFRFDPTHHDTGTKTIFGRTGNWGWQDVPLLCVENPLHASFFVEKLWSYFIPTPPDTETRDGLIGIYESSGRQVRPVLESILMHPDFYEGPPMVKPPVVHLVSMLRALGRYIDTDAWSWICQPTGQFLFHPPNVSGWDDERWLDTSRMRARWNMVHWVLRKTSVNPWNNTYSKTETPEEALARAKSTWGGVTLMPEHEAELLAFARTAQSRATATWQHSPYRGLRQNALLQLIGVSADVMLA